MESSPQSRSDIGSHIAMILVTAANLIVLTVLYEYIAWYTFEPDGSVTRLWLLTNDFFIWRPIPIAASILAIAAYGVMIFYNRYWFRMTAQIVINIVGIAVVLSLLSIFPFDFSVIPNATAVDAAPRLVTVFLLLMAIVYGSTAIVLSARLVRRLVSTADHNEE
jgi:predicted glycosyltransferase